jgi:hypothetical protein
MTPATPSEAADPSASPTVVSPPLRGGAGRRIGIVIGAVVVVVVLLLALGFAGVLPGFSHPRTSGTGPGGSTPTLFAITFTEAGLPAGTTWEVTLGGTTNASSGPSIVFHEANGAYAYTVGTSVGYLASPASGTITVAGTSAVRGISFVPVTSQYAVTFRETGLAAGATWTVTLAGVPVSGTASTLVFEEDDGTYSYSVANVGASAPTPSSGSLTVAGAPVSQPIAFATPAGGAGPYLVSFSESGLATGTSWTVVLNGSSLSAAAPAELNFHATNGTFPFSVSAANGWTPAPRSGTITVAGTRVDQLVTFSAPLTGGNGSVTFNESGLPSGVAWVVALYAAPPFEVLFEGTGNQVSFDVPNGSYAWMAQALGPYAGSQTAGSLTVNSSASFENVQFAAPAGFAVRFTESGLAPGTPWYVVVNSVQYESTSDHLTAHLPDGSFFFSVFAVDYSASPAFGTVTVNGTDLNESVTFSSSGYILTFTPFGLIPGTSWNLTIGAGQYFATAPGAVQLTGFANGSVTVQPHAPGYAAVPASFVVVVAGANQNVSVVFHRSTAPLAYNVTLQATGLPNGSLWIACLAYGCVAATDASTDTQPLPNGTTGWSAFAPGFVATPSAGTITVAGGTVTQTVAFAPAAAGLSAVFFEPGLSSLNFSAVGGWSATLGAQTISTAGLVPLFFLVANGSYTWSLTLPSGISATSAAGTLVIAGSFTAGGQLADVGGVILFALTAGPVIPLEVPGHAFVVGAPWARRGS